MMALSTIVINFFLKPQEMGAALITRVLGYFLLMIAAATGLYFLFEFLVPFLGYTQSGVILTLILACGGFLLLLLSRRKPQSPLDEVMETVAEICKPHNLDKLIQKNSYKIVLFSFITGLILSQFKGCNKNTLSNLGCLLKKILHYKTF